MDVGRKLIVSDKKVNNHYLETVLLPKLSKYRYLGEFVVTRCQITPKIAVILAKALNNEYHRKVEVVDIASNPIGPVGGEVLLNVINNKLFLTYLDVSNCELCRGKMIKFSHDGLPLYEIDSRAFAQILLLVKNHSKITFLDISKNYIDTKSASAFAEALRDNKSLRFLDISHNRILKRGIFFLLRRISHLVKLSIAGNQLESDSGKIIAEALVVNGNLKVLDLSHNNLGAEGVYYIGTALKENHTLLELNISWNHLGPNGAKNISDVLQFNQRGVIRLHLNGNEIKKRDKKGGNTDLSGVLSLIQGLRVNRGLQHISLRQNDLTSKTYKTQSKTKDPVVVEFGELIKFNRVLKTIDISQNGIDYKGKQVINRALKVRPHAIPAALSVMDVMDFKFRELLQKPFHRKLLRKNEAYKTLRVKVFRLMFLFLEEKREVLS